MMLYGLETLGTDYPAMQRHVPEEQQPGNICQLSCSYFRCIKVVTKSHKDVPWWTKDKQFV
jgi:hypothetical protein